MRNDYHITEIGKGHVTSAQDDYTLTVPPTNDSTYHDAQIADYTLQERNFKWTAPVKMTVQARFNTTDVRGTSGFGFWNHPFSPEMRGLPRLPQAAWFFYGSPPNNMPLAKGVTGHGWKCATIDATRWQFLALAPTAPLAFFLMRVPVLYNALWGIGQDAIGVREHLLPSDIMMGTHTYGINWQENGITFTVDGDTVLESPFGIRGKMGFIAWIDNQYAVVTPQGNFGWGLVGMPQTQTLHIDKIKLDNNK